MEKIRWTCPECGKKFSVPQEKAGGRTGCTRCGTEGVVHCAPESAAAQKSGRVSMVLATIIGLLGIITLPGSFRYCYRVGTGHAISRTYDSENLAWDNMSPAERAPYLARWQAEGVKFAILMTFGQHVPVVVLVLVAVGLISKATTMAFKRVLRIAFLGIAAGGVIFLSMGIHLREGTPVPESMGLAFTFYFGLSAVLWAVIGIGVAVRMYVFHETAKVGTALPRNK